MRFLAAILLALGILALPFSVSAKPVTKRKTANATASAFVLDRTAPQAQRLENEAAKQELQNFLARLGPHRATDEKNQEEFQRQLEQLEQRGYTALEQPLSSGVFIAAQSLTLHRAPTDDPTALEFDFYYSQYFVKTGESPTSQSILPKLSLKGKIFLRCAGKMGNCEWLRSHVQHSILQWGHPRSGRKRGGESSSGGTND